MRRTISIGPLLLVLLGFTAQASAKGSTHRAAAWGEDAIHLRAQNEFQGLKWDVVVWHDRLGYHRSTTVTETKTQRHVSSTVDISAKDEAWLWQRIEGMHCWNGPKHNDWVARDAETGTVTLIRNGKREELNYAEYWNVAEAIDQFGQGQLERATARLKGLGNNV